MKCIYGNGEETWECQRTSNNGEVLKRISDEIHCDKPKMFGEICEANSQCHEDLTCVEGNCWAYCESNKKLNEFTSRQSMEDAGWSFTRILVDRYGNKRLS